MVAVSKDCGVVPTPSRRRSSAAGDKAKAKAEGQLAAKRGGAAALEGLPAEAKGLTWPQKFCESPKGDRLELSEDGALARRTSGVGYGAAFVGPLSLERSGSAYFEVEVNEVEASRSQTMAIGITCSLPAAKSLRVERARDLGEGTYIVGYDLPKVFANGAEVSKISTKEWRPLKELKVGDRIGLLIQRRSMELTVFVNGVKKASAAGLGGGQRWPGEVYGVVDLHGAVKSMWLRSAAAARRQLQRCATVQMPAPPPSFGLGAAALPALPSSGAGAGGAPEAATQAAPQLPQAGVLVAVPKIAQEAGQRRNASKAALDQGAAPEAGARPQKRARTTSFPCGCMVHLLRSAGGDVQHVPQKGMFVIGREESSNLMLDSPLVPKMVSRRHATVSSTGGAVLLEDCNSTNGTFVNGRRVGQETLRHGDLLVVGNPTHSPKEFHFRVSMPGAA